MGSDSLFWGLRAGRFVVFQHRFVEWNQKKRIQVRLVYLFSPKPKKIWDLLLDAFLEPLFFSRKCWDIWLPQNECNKQTWLKHQPYKGGPPNKPVLSVGPKSHSELILGWGRETWVKPPWTFWGIWHGATHGNSPCITNGDGFWCISCGQIGGFQLPSLQLRKQVLLIYHPQWARRLAFWTFLSEDLVEEVEDSCYRLSFRTVGWQPARFVLGSKKMHVGSKFLAFPT